jgi:hypothetical protein
MMDAGDNALLIHAGRYSVASRPSAMHNCIILVLAMRKVTRRHHMASQFKLGDLREKVSLDPLECLVFDNLKFSVANQ